MCSETPSYSGILSGNCKGHVWVNQILKPELAMVYSYPVGGYAILGQGSHQKVYENFVDFLEKEHFKLLKDKDIHEFEFSFEDKITEEHILKLFSSKNIHSEEEFFYRSYTKNLDDACDSQDIHRVDEAFLRKLNASVYGSADFLEKPLLESFHDYNHFLENSLAYVCIRDGHIVGVILGSASYENFVSIDIKTNASYQNQGIGHKLTMNFLKTCQELGLIAQWNCTASNIGSQKTAEKSGFQLFKKDKFYWFDI